MMLIEMEIDEEIKPLSRNRRNKSSKNKKKDEKIEVKAPPPL